MIALKKKPEKASSTKLVPSPISGVVPPVEYRFKPGQSGNPGGKPRILRDTLTSQLHQTAEDGRRVADHVVENLIANAQSPWPHSVQAFRTIREMVEPTEAEEAETTASQLHSALVAGFLKIATMKRADAIEV